MTQGLRANPSRCRRTRRAGPGRRILLIAIATAGMGCAEKPPPAPPESMTSDALVQRYSDMLLAGLEQDGIHIRAQRRDPRTGELLDLQMEAPTGLLTARRARFVVHAADDTFSLELLDVYVAPAAAGTSRLTHLKSLRTGPIEAGVDVRETLLTLPENELLSTAKNPWSDG